MIYIVIYENGNVIHDFSKLSLTHCFFFFFSSTKNNLLAGVSKGKCCPNSVTFFTAQSKLSVWEYHYYVCVSICVCGLLLRVSWWPIHRISSSGAYQSDSASPSCDKKKNHTFHRAMCVSPIFTSCHLWDLGACKKVWGHYW